MLQGSRCPGVGEKWQGDSHDERPPTGPVHYSDHSWRNSTFLIKTLFLQHLAPVLAGMWGAKMSGSRLGNFEDSVFLVEKEKNLQTVEKSGNQPGDQYWGVQKPGHLDTGPQISSGM